MAQPISSEQEIHAEPAQRGSASLKYSCYLICFLGLSFSVSAPDVSRFGLFFLWLIAPFWMAHRLRFIVARSNLLWLILAVAAAFGVFSSGRHFLSGICLVLSTGFWILHLCFGALPMQHIPFREVCRIACVAFFSDPWLFFVSTSPDDAEIRRKGFARRIYIFYILLALLVAAVLLAVRADGRIDGLLRTFWELTVRQSPLILSCLILALFPAAFLYGFLIELERLAVAPPDAVAAEKTGGGFTPILPWYAPCLLLTIVNTLFLAAELYYSYYLKEIGISADYGFYDVFALLGMIFLSLVVLFFQLDPSTNRNRAFFICLSISDAGLLIIACYRLWNYVCFYGFWGERILACTVFLLWTILSLCILPFSAKRSQGALHRVGVAAVVVVVTLLVLPKGLVLAQTNTSIFIHKYNERQLEAQRNGNDQSPVLLSRSDLDVKAVVACGIDGVPALARITRIEDVIIEDQTLGNYAQKTILELLCFDLNITPTGEPERDLAAIRTATAVTPRYRLPTNWFIAIRSLEDIEWNIT